MHRECVRMISFEKCCTTKSACQMDFWSSTYEHRRSLDRSRGRSFDHRLLGRSIAQSLERSVARSLGRSAARSLGRSVALSLDRSFVRLLGRTIARAIARSLNRSVDRSIARSFHRSIAWTECRLKNSALGSNIGEALAGHSLRNRPGSGNLDRFSNMPGGRSGRSERSGRTGGRADSGRA